MRIKVRNFQSIRKADLEAEGFTVITGRSNVGKTALIRACQAAFFGIPGNYFIREGENFAGVAITDDDLEIIWRKTSEPNPKKPSALQVNGVVHTKIGTDHIKLTESCGVLELLTSQARIRPQFSMQHDNIFMLADSETTVAEILKLLGRVDVVTTAQRNAKGDLNRALSKRKIREGDLESTKEKLKEFASVPGLRIRFETLSEAYAIMDKENQHRTDLIGKINRVGQLEPGKIPEPIEVELDEVKPGLIRWLDELMQLDFGIEKLSVDRETVDEEIEEQQVLRKAVEDQLDECPTCDRPFDGSKHKH